MQVTDQWLGYREGKKLDVPKSPHKLYQDGYIDFTPWPNNSTSYRELQDFVVNGPRRSSAFDDFHYYCTCFPYQKPNPTAFDSVCHIRKIALANWMLLIEYLQRNYLKSDFERNMDQYRKIDDVSKLQAHQYAIQRRQVTMNIWIRRWSSVYPENIKAAMRRLGFRSRQGCMNQVDEYEDWNYLLTKINELAAALIRTSDNLTTHMDWIENQMAQQQSRDINRLTWLGAIFVPLSFVCSIFSMGESFAPGDRFFWIYFVIAVPSMVLVSLLVMPDKFRQRARNRALERLDRTLGK